MITFTAHFLSFSRVLVFKMVARKVINMSLKAENIIGVYRNYAFISKSRQIISTMRILVETVICTAIFVYDRGMYKPAGPTKDRLIYIFQFYQFVKLLNGPIIMMISILNSSSFKLFIDKFTSMHHQFLNEPSYIKCSKKLRVIFVIIIALAFITSIGFETSKMIGRLHRVTELKTCFLIIIFLVNLVAVARYILEHAVMYIYITMVRNLLKCLNISIFDIEVKYDKTKKRLCSDSRESNDILKVDQVEQWATKLKCLLTCSRSLSVCFKAQVNM